MGRVRIAQGLGHPPRPVTAVFLLGDHDLGSRDLVADALARLRTDVLVDLSWCTFVHSSIIGLIAAKQTELAAEGLRLELIVPSTHTHLVDLHTCLFPGTAHTTGNPAPRAD